MLPRALDALLDRLVVPGYSKLGYAARAAAWRSTDPPPSALAGRTVVVTGATSGLGRAAAARCARLGATVVLVGRDDGRLERARADVAAGAPATVEVERCDVSLLADVRALSVRLLERTEPLHAVIHDAGVLLDRRSETAEGNEVTLATHVLGPHLLSRLLAGRPPARTIWVSSGGMYTQRLDLSDLQSRRSPWSGTRAYARTKRMQVVLAELWAQRTPAPAVVHAMHPGWAATPGVASSLPAFSRLTGPILRTAEQGADTMVWLAAAAEPARSSGRFWHDRRPRPTHLLPGTRERPGDRDALWAACERLTAG